MKIVENKRATAALRDYTDKLASEPVIVTRNGKPIAALIALENTDLETARLSTDPQFLEMIEKSRRRHTEEGGISSADLRRLFGLPLARESESTPPRYWIVGAAREGTDDHYEQFLRQGYWELFYTDQEQPLQAAKRNQMRAGDRIAIKKMVGGRHGKGRVHIRAIGVIVGLDSKSKRVSVRWEAVNLHREVAGHSLFRSIHGPYDAKETIVTDVFQQVTPRS